MSGNSELQMFTKLVSDYQGRFVRFANSYVRDQVIAEDITTEALLYYWEHRQDINPDLNVVAYLLSTIKHKCLNFLQHQQAQSNLKDRLRDIQEWEFQTRIMSLQACEPEELFTAEVYEIVNRTLSLLPEKTRHIFIMSRYENKSHKEIAKLLNMTTKGVEFHISKSLKILRKSLKDYFPVLGYLFLSGFFF